MSRKITVEIEIAGPDLSVQKDIDLLREILTKYHNWAIAGYLSSRVAGCRAMGN